MKVKVSKLWEYLKQTEMTKEDFAQKLHLSIGEVEKMLRGEAVGINTARKFINGLSANTAQELIDWDAIGVDNPLADDKKEVSVEDEGFEDFDDFEEAEDCDMNEPVKLSDFEDFEAYENYKYANCSGEDDEDETDD
jgi:transcriptional regulator with XRE-family HTH domain